MTEHFPGLTAEEVAASRKRGGSNAITPPKREPWHVLYAEKFKDPVIRILLIAAAVAFLVGLHEGNFIEGIGIILAVLLSTGLSFLNEYRAAREFDILNRVSDDEPVPVVRNGRHGTAPRKDLVVGDIVLIEQGMEIPADGVVLEAVNLSLNESSLTGESEPVRKDASTEDVPGLAFPRNFAPRGCTVPDGHGVLRVTAVGDRTEIGKTARAAAETPDAMTPLARQLEKLAGMIAVAAFAAAALIFVAQTVRGAANGELHALAEQGGKLVKLPLQPGQWLCFAVLAVALLILTAQVWAPTLRGGLRFLGLPNLFPSWLDQKGKNGLIRLAAAAGGVFVAGALAGLATGMLNFRVAWLPLSALTAFISYFMLAVTVIVVAVPEGLPMCVALALAYSMRRMTASNNLVRKLHACETIGAASVICSDKTGTLTMNEMRVHRALFPAVADNMLPVGGAAADFLAEAAAANATAHLQETDSGTEALGNPTEAAILLWLAACGREYRKERAGFALKQQITFSTERKYMASAGVSAVDGGARLYVKGAPEIVLARCATIRTPEGEAELTEEARAAIAEEAASYQGRGMRALAFSSKRLPEAALEEAIDPDFDGCVWEGFFAIADPIRPDVPKAMERARAAGIQVKVVTGDNRSTAREIARQAGLWREDDTDDRIVTGERFAAMPDDEAAAAAERIKVMSRARPLDKLRLVRLLQAKGEVVAVTGDGTNDAPALNYADVGLAMGKTGTAVAKEAADIIILDDSFASIVNAVAWGRSLYANIQKFVVFQLTINVAAVGIALLGPFLGVTLPLTVVQMLWVNLIMDTFAALALASEPPDWDLMENAPRGADAFIVTKPMRQCILGVGAAFLALFLAVMALQRWIDFDPAGERGRHNLTVFFTAFVFLQFWNLWNARVFGTVHSALRNLRESRGFLLMAGVIVLGQVLLVQFGGEMFRVTPLSAFEWVMAFVLTSPVLWVGEFWRLHLRSRDDPDYYRYS